MIFVPRLPKRPYKSFVEYKAKNEYECDVCSGRKRVVSPDAQNDPVEGYKFAARIDCPKCNGKGKLSELQAKHTYEEIISSWKKLYDEVKSQREGLLGALGKVSAILSKEEIELLGLSIKEYDR